MPRDWYRNLNVEYLKKNNFLKQSDHNYTSKYKKFSTISGGEFQFAGQLDKEGNPNGIVRVIYPQGSIYEGNMTPDGKRNGWGIYYDASFDYVSIGWRKDNLRNGNILEIDPKTFEVMHDRSGWYEHHKQKG